MPPTKKKQLRGPSPPLHRFALRITAAISPTSWFPTDFYCPNHLFADTLPSVSLYLGGSRMNARNPLLAILAIALSLLPAACAPIPHGMTGEQLADTLELHNWIHSRPPQTKSASVALFADAGVWPKGAREIVYALESVGIPCDVDDHELLGPRLFSKSVLILPGGWAPLQLQTLSPDHQKNLRSFVERGGRIIAVCAGAYLISERVSWKGEELPYPIALFDGIAVGPVNDYPRPAQTSLVGTTDGQALGLLFNRPYYLNGGSTFEGGTKVQTLATFPDGTAAIIRRQVGQGDIILLGIHPEIATDDNPSMPLDAGHFYKRLLQN